MYTVEKDFSTKIYHGKIIEEEGRNFNINYSRILTKLIQECGRLCENYASDLFIDWYSISEKLKNKTMETSIYLFGIRENGVDHTDFILSRYNNSKEYASYEYRKIYRLDIKVDDDLIIMKFYEIDKPYSEKKEML